MKPWAEYFSKPESKFVMKFVFGEKYSAFYYIGKLDCCGARISEADS